MPVYLPDHEEALIKSDATEIEDATEDGLHGGDGEASVDDELRERGGAFVRATSVDEEQGGEEAEFGNRKVGGERRMETLLAGDADS